MLMKNNIYIYIAVMALTTYLIRVLPLTIIRKQIQNRFVKSFLYYVPYVTLAVMTFPAILHATSSPWAGLAALLAGMVAAWFRMDLLKVAVTCCSVVLILEFFLV